MNIKKELIRIEKELVENISKSELILQSKLTVLYNYFENILNDFGFEKPPFTYKNDREFLELVVAMTEVNHCLLLKEKMSMEPRIQDLQWSPLYNYLAELKVKYFMQEICEENGMEIVDINEKGFLVRDKNKKTLN